MCGIVGFIGKEGAKEAIIKGLKKLEYRGYDSAGIALLNDSTNEIEVIKDKGRVDNLERLVGDRKGKMGMGHTRWATHGIPSARNAHPHYSMSKRFIIVHNGVIDNFHKIKIEKLKDFTFRSDTDTEVIINLVEHYVNELHVDNEEHRVSAAIRKALSNLEGSYALIIIDTETPDRLYFAKNKAPLIVGVSDDDVIISSDAMSFNGYANELMNLEDGTFGIAYRDHFNVYDILGFEREYHMIPYNGKDEDADKGVFEHYMLKEIDEQPGVIRNLIQTYFNEEDIVIDEEIISKMRSSTRINIVACGTSYYAGCIGEYYFEQLCGIPVSVYIASELAYKKAFFLPTEFFIFISQSGETADSIKVLTDCKEMKYQTLAIINQKDSTIDRLADHSLYLYAGKEIAVASTKAYVAEVVVLAILARAVSYRVTNLKKNLGKAALAIEKVVNAKNHIKAIVAALDNQDHAFYIGRGLDYYVALEAALKLKEVSYIHAEGFASGELKHGTIALIKEGTPVIAIITQEATNLLTRSNLHETASRGAHTFVISSYNLKESSDDVSIPDVPEYLAPIVSVVVCQLVAYYIALRRGCDVDKPKNLAKSVTVE